MPDTLPVSSLRVGASQPPVVPLLLGWEPALQPAGLGCSSWGHRCPRKVALGHTMPTCSPWALTHTHGAGHTHSHDGDSAVAPVCHHHAIISLTCPGSATTAQGGSTVSVEMPGMLWQKVFSESCTFEKALKKSRPLCLNSNWRQTHKLSILFISYCLI